MLLLLFLINLHSCCFGRLKNSKRLCLFFLFCLALLSLAIDSIDSTSFYDRGRHAPFLLHYRPFFSPLNLPASRRLTFELLQGRHGCGRARTGAKPFGLFRPRCFLFSPTVAPRTRRAEVDTNHTIRLSRLSTLIRPNVLHSPSAM